MKRSGVGPDSEQFCMHHLSAMKLCLTLADLVVFVISLDSGYDLVINDGGNEHLK